MLKRKKKVIIIVGIIFAILIGAALLISYFVVGRMVAEGMLYCNEENDTKENSIKQLELWDYDLEAFQNKYSKDTFQITAEDGTQIHVARYPAITDTLAGVVILVHGHGGDYQCVLPLAEMYLENDYEVYAYDQRASGESENELVSFGYYEKQDVAALVSYAKGQTPGSPIYVHGQSMGAATAALYAATEHARDNLTGLILDSSYDNMENMFLGFVEVDGISGKYMIWCGDWYLKANYGFGFGDVDIIKSAKEIQTPTLVIQCTYDEIAPVEVGKAIYDGINNDNKAYWQVDSAHIEALIDVPRAYEEQVFEFLLEIP